MGLPYMPISWGGCGVNVDIYIYTIHGVSGIYSKMDVFLHVSHGAHPVHPVMVFFVREGKPP